MGVLGTTLKVDVEEGSTDLTVFDGKVSIATDKNETIVAGGGKARASADGSIVEGSALAEDLKAWAGIKGNLVPADSAHSAGGLLPGLGVVPEASEEKAPVQKAVPAPAAVEEELEAAPAEENKGKSTLLGDVNDDFKRSAADVELLRKYLYENFKLDAHQMELGDVDGNGKISPEDMRILEYKVSGVGDFDGDGTVDDADLSMIQDAVEYSGDVSKFDVNRDGKVNKGDLFLFKSIMKSLSKFAD